MAKNKDPRPHSFFEPSLYSYALLLALSPYYMYLTLTGEIKEITANPRIADVPPPFLANSLLISRILSVLMGVLTVLVVYFIGKEICGERAGLLSSFFAAFTMSFVNVAHFATVESLVMFWIMSSMLFLVMIVKTGGRKYYLLAGVVSGLAISTKYTAGLLLLSFLAAHFLSVKRGKVINRNLVIGLVLMPVFFFAGTPYALFELEAFVNDIFRITSIVGGGRTLLNPHPGYVSIILHLMNALGFPMFLLAVLGMGDAALGTIRKREGYRYSLLFFSFIIPLYIIISRWNFVELRFIMPGIPFLAVFSGRYVSESIELLRGTWKKGLMVFVFLVMVYSMAYVLVADGKFTSDSRYGAAGWIRENIEPGQVIEKYGRYNPPIPEDVRVYTPPVEGGIDLYNKTETEAFDKYLDELETRKPDYIVLSSSYYGRYLVDSNPFPARTKYFSDLLGEKTNYRIVARFGPPPEKSEGASGFGSREPVESRIWRSMSLTPSLELVDPAILILKRI
ncbi:MAG: glycosyltransferase family 39 protein [Candidatus Altiarchaeota archaeon]|nr:glycosyltransferase family 39 protein [Candidatus Altiarchaeota archaeon]